MDPKEMTYEISRCYSLDHGLVDQDLLNATNGLRRSRSLKGLATCSSLFDWHKHAVGDWKYLRQTEAFFKKNRCFADRRQLRDAALAAFQSCEAQCRATNERITDVLLGMPFEADLRNRLFKARQYIARVLGDFQAFHEAIPGLVRVSSGASANSGRSSSMPQLKLSLRPYCSSKGKDEIKAVYKSFGFVCQPKVCDSNRIELVPKDWRKDRTIACEPEGNCALQLAFDSYAKRRLKRFGIDLHTQSRNQERAKHASIHNDFVTVDFSSASDTVAYATVAWLIPEPWFVWLDSVRSPRYRGVFGTGEYDKFSSMGNGSTFTVETLIFASLCHAAGSRDFLVYGDDVILEKDHFAVFKQMAEFLGFTINAEKSFVDGPFRESCGGEYFNGENVTPIAIKTIDERKASLCHLVNSLGGLTSQWEELGKYLISIKTQMNLPFVPYTENTMAGVWIDPRHARQLGLLRRRQLRRSGPRLDYFKAYIPLTGRMSFKKDLRGYFLWFLLKAEQVGFKGPWDGSERIGLPPTQTSSVTIFEHRYVRKWVVWHQPNNGTIPSATLLWAPEGEASQPVKTA